VDGRYDIQATALQCWTSIQENFGVNACTIMSMMSQKLMPSACEVDVTGVAAMYALQLASGHSQRAGGLEQQLRRRSGQVRLLPLRQLGQGLPARYRDQDRGDPGHHLGEENTYGAVAGRTPAGPVTFARVSTDDRTAASVPTWAKAALPTTRCRPSAARAVVEVPGLQKLMRYICKNGFEHHAAMNASQHRAILAEAFETYLGWEVYHHEC
jgi:L-fucose isomerase-like protein